jgi:hypothetical protein
MSILQALALIPLLLAVNPGDGSTTEIVSLCELVKAPSLRDGEIVRIQTFYSFAEGGILYDPKCNNRDSWAYVKWSELEVAQALDTVAQRKERGIVTGIFEGEWAGPDGDGYGHLGYYRLQVRVRHVDGARLAPQDTAQPNYTADAPLSRARQELWSIDSRWLNARMARDAEALSKIESDNYIMVSAQGDVIHKGGLLSTLPSSGGGWQTRVFVWDEEAGAVIGKMILSQGAKAKEQADCGSYINFYRQVRGSWSLAMTVCEPTGSMASETATD